MSLYRVLSKLNWKNLAGPSAVISMRFGPCQPKLHWRVRLVVVDAARVATTARRVRVPNRAVVVPDWADIVRVGLEQELRRGQHPSCRLFAKRAWVRVTGLFQWPFDVEIRLTRITPILIPPHRSTPYPPSRLCLTADQGDRRHSIKPDAIDSLCLLCLLRWSINRACQTIVGPIYIPASIARRWSCSPLRSRYCSAHAGRPERPRPRGSRSDSRSSRQRRRSLT